MEFSALERFFEPFELLPFDDASAQLYGQLRANLKRTGQPIGPNDIMIAAIVLTHRLTVVTHNIWEFGRVPALRLEDWESKAKDVGSEDYFM